MQVFSGIQPSGILHIGNYIGAIKNWIALQKEHDCIFSIVDLHAITVPQKPSELRTAILETAALYLACGIDPKKSILFVQSAVPQHAELAWILNTIAKISELKLMHQFKDKSRKSAENITMGLFDYPVLMAADILLYKTNLVPIGEDQQQHLELARELARRFNSLFGDVFVVPEGVSPKVGARIMGLDDPTKKMSKSAESVLNYIALTDSSDVVRKKISRAVTDSGSEITMSKSKPAVSNLLTLYHAVTDRPIVEIEHQYATKGYKDFKAGLTDEVCTFLAPLQKKMAEYLADPVELQRILKKGEQSARTRAEQTLDEVKKRVGLGIT